MKHIDSHLHVRGESQYLDDVPPPAGLLHAAVFGSPKAHGNIVDLDLGRVGRSEGVVAVYRAESIPGANRLGPVIQDEQLLAEEEVSYIGQPIAVVVAKSAESARRARDKIEVGISDLPVITDPRVAYDKGDLIHPPRTVEMGDVDSAWAKCNAVVEGRCEIGGQEHLYLETNRSRAIPREDGSIQVFSSTQSPASVQRALSVILGLPMHKIEIDVKRLGGGFGGKEDQGAHWAAMASLAALLLQKPVELVLNRLEDIQMTGKRHPYSSDFKIGLTREGSILAFEAWHYQNSGAFADLSPPVLERTLLHSTNGYSIPNVRVTAAPCRTNLQPHTAFRGFGGPQGMFVMEAAIDKAAEALSIPTEEIQSRNLLKDGDTFYYGQRVQECRMEPTWKEAVEEFGLSQLRDRVEVFNRNHFEFKKGCALMPVCFGISFTKTHLNQGNSLVHVYRDGSVGVTTGGIEMGQGISTNMAAIAARTFGIGESRVRVESTNTTRIANMSPSAASATTDLNGNATIAAVEQILKGMKEAAAEEIGAPDAGEISIRDEIVLHRGAETRLTWEDVVLKTYMARKRLSAHGFYSTPGLHFDRKTEKGHPFAYHVYGTAIFEVTVDCLRGTYIVDQAKIVHDLGRAINPDVDLGQVEGGLAQGMGWMTMEDLQWDENGRCTSHALSTYKAPDVYFMPDDMEVRFLEDVDNEFGPLGTKAVGEPPLMYGIGVFFAIRNAMKAFAPKTELSYHAPMTPERVLMEIHKDIDFDSVYRGKIDSIEAKKEQKILAK